MYVLDYVIHLVTFNIIIEHSVQFELEKAISEEIVGVNAGCF